MTDLELLADALENGNINDDTRDAFLEMRESILNGDRDSLTDRQRKWVRGSLGVIEYENLWSSGKVPRGAEVPLPPALQNLPTRTPGRKAS
jgi:hypothetical protein